jgi:hypothetical protein
MNNPALESEDSRSHFGDGSSIPPPIAAQNPAVASQSTASSTRHQRIISPIPTRQDSTPSRPLAEHDDFPSHLICPFHFEPPIASVTFDIPDLNGNISPQVFEHTDLYRFIATPGMIGTEFDTVHHVKHPMSNTIVSQDIATTFI